MTKIIGSEDCGNSPKNTFVEKMTIALEQGDIDTFLANSSDDICWVQWLCIGALTASASPATA